MDVVVTGATGFIGSHIVTELQSHGHRVIGLVRDDAQAAELSGQGAVPKVADLYDHAAVVQALREADAAIHTASPGDATSADFDSAVAESAIEAFSGTGKPYVHIGGAWVFGNNQAITEESPIKSPALVAWRQPIEERIVKAAGMRGIVLISSVAYGDGGGGIPGLLLGSPRDSDGNLIMLGSGEQHWTTVHAADLAQVFRLILENEQADGTFVVGDGLNPTLAELTQAAAAAVGAPGAVPGSDEEARSRLGEYFAEVLLLDQGMAATRARRELGWQPSRPGLVEDFRSGSYARG
jgi:nucleoside-diphosphate-sugar epimerase